MGNSGSLNNYTPAVDEIHRNPPWAQSLPREQHVQQIKVLPDIQSGARLRSTNNGLILHSGGTLTGRKDFGGGIHRSRSISSPQHEMKHKMGLQRHSTQLDMIVNSNKCFEEASKRFGSEPDLRFPHDENSNNSKPIPSKVFRGKKKKAPPTPNNMEADIDYDPSRFGWKPKQTPEMIKKSPQPRKLRLFKTKAESKKVAANTKLASEASDMHFRKPFVDRRDKYMRDKLPENDLGPVSLRNIDERDVEIFPQKTNWNKSKVQLLPMPHFRREKSFDLSLLISRKSKVEDSTKTNMIRSGTGKRQENIPSPSQLRQKDVEMRISGSPKNPKLLHRRTSQPPQMKEFDFQRELEEATRKRSMAVKSKDIEEKNKILPRPQMELKKESPKIQKSRTSMEVKSKPSAEFGKKAKEISVNKEVKESKSNVAVTSQRHNEIVQQDLPSTVAPPLPDRPMPKTFYFGMDDSISNDNPMDKVENEAIDIFAKSLLQRKQKPRMTESSESAASSEVEDNYHNQNTTDDDTDGILLQLRPTLPKKQFEIPRFSPAAAWRLLSIGDTEKEGNSWVTSEKLEVLEVNERSQDTSSRNEDRIERIYREPIPGLQDNKSGDSGISGDAGLLELAESPGLHPITDVTEKPKVGPFLSPWTPQQDLGEESSSDDGENKNKIQGTNFGTRAHVFSLSLPRENQLSVYSEKIEKQSFNSLQKFRRSVTGAFGGNGNLRENPTECRNSNNWFLSRSAPNSIENSQLSPLSKFVFDQEETNEESLAPNIKLPMQPPSFSYLTGGKHVMYLPQKTIEEVDDIDKELEKDTRSYYDHKEEVANHNQRENLQDSPTIPSWNVKNTPQKQSKSKNHRFTFQSTIRQIERRRLAEKLSKEAEQKEMQRLSELEAMRRVEEEFQKKRAREKASIRQQLRMFSMEESQCTSLPSEWQTNSHRAEPDGAVSSPAESSIHPSCNEYFENGTQHESYIEVYPKKSNYRENNDDYNDRYVSKFSSPRVSIVNHRMEEYQPPTTEVLSELRSSGRRYMEYRSDFKTENQTHHHHHHNGTTEHPKVVCKIPSRDIDQTTYSEDSLSKANYRKDFALGKSIGSSESELSIAPGNKLHSSRF